MLSTIIIIITISIKNELHSEAFPPEAPLSKARRHIETIAFGKARPPNSKRRLSGNPQDLSKHKPRYSLQEFKRYVRRRKHFKNIIPHAPDRFDHTIEPHLHFVCSHCGNLCDLHLSSPVAYIKNALESEGFQIGKISITITGACPNCASEPSRKEKK